MTALTGQLGGGTVRARRGEAGRDGAASNDRWARSTMLGLLIVAFPILVFGPGADKWFLRDEWFFITDRDMSSLNDLFRDYNGHWSTLPIIAFRGMWWLFGAKTYVPYLAASVGVHLITAALLWLVMRRCDVSAWVATAVAGAFVFFGPGERNIMWGFQIGYVGGLAFGLLFLLLVERPRPVGRRDALGVLAGLCALMCAGTGVTMVAVVGLAVLLRRGWRTALLLTVPLGAVYLAWLSIVHPTVSSPFGSPSLDAVRSYVTSGLVGTFEAVGHWWPVTAVLAAVLAAGVVAAWRAAPPGKGLDRLAVPIALLAGVVFYFTTVAVGRWWTGDEGATASRYLYIAAALLLPPLGVAIDALRRQWAPLGIGAVAVLLVAAAANATEFGGSVFSETYFRNEKSVLTEVVRMPFAPDVPPDVRPFNELESAPGLTIGFLLAAVRADKLDPASDPVTPSLENEMRIRLGFAQSDANGASPSCPSLGKSLHITPSKGDHYLFAGTITVQALEAGKPASRAVKLYGQNGGLLATELDGLDLQIAPVDGAAYVCPLP